MSLSPFASPALLLTARYGASEFLLEGACGLRCNQGYNGLKPGKAITPVGNLTSKKGKKARDDLIN